MLPYLLAIAGGYLIGHSRKDETFSKGGETNGFKFLDGGDGVEYEIWEKDGVRYRVPIERDEDVEGEYEELIIHRYFEDAEPIDKFAKGGQTKWIQKAIKKPGALRAEAKREGLIEGEEKLSKTDLKKLEKKGGKTARRARLAQTLKTL